MSEAGNRLVRGVTAAMLMAVVGVASAQTTGDSNVGQQLFTTTLSPQCSGCHSTTDPAAVNSLTSIRANITNRATPAGPAGTMSFEKALEALNAALSDISLGNKPTGMKALFTLTTAQVARSRGLHCWHCRSGADPALLPGQRADLRRDRSGRQRKCHGDHHERGHRGPGLCYQ